MRTTEATTITERSFSHITEKHSDDGNELA